MELWASLAAPVKVKSVGVLKPVIVTLRKSEATNWLPNCFTLVTRAESTLSEMMCFPLFGILIGTFATEKLLRVSDSAVVAVLATLDNNSRVAKVPPEHSGAELLAGSAHSTQVPVLEPAPLLTTEPKLLQVKHWSELGPSHEWQLESQLAQRFSPAMKYFPAGHLHSPLIRERGPP